MGNRRPPPASLFQLHWSEGRRERGQEGGYCTCRVLVCVRKREGSHSWFCPNPSTIPPRSRSTFVPSLTAPKQLASTREQIGRMEIYVDVKPIRTRVLADLASAAYLWHQTDSGSQVNRNPGGLSPVELISFIITVINEALIKAF